MHTDASANASQTEFDLSRYKEMGSFLTKEVSNFLSDQSAYVKFENNQITPSYLNEKQVEIGYKGVLQHLILCEHASYGSVHSATRPVKLGEAEVPHTIYHITIDPSISTEQGDNRAFAVAAMKSAAVMMMVVEKLKLEQHDGAGIYQLPMDNDRLHEIEKVYQAHMNAVHQLITDPKTPQSSAPFGKQTTKMIKKMQADIAGLLLRDVPEKELKEKRALIKALAENINIEFGACSTFRHQAIDNKEVTSAQGFIGGMSEDQKSVYGKMYEILIGIIAPGDESQDGRSARASVDKKAMNRAIKSQLKDFMASSASGRDHDRALHQTASHILLEMPHAERLVLYQSMKNDRSAFLNGNYIVNGQKKGLTARNTSKMMLFQANRDSNGFLQASTVLMDASMQASMTGPRAGLKEILKQNIKMHGLEEQSKSEDSTKSNSKEIKAMINLRYHAAFPNAVFNFTRSRPLNILLTGLAAVVLAVPALFIPLIAAYSQLRHGDYRTVFRKVDILSQMIDYHDQKALFKSESKAYESRGIKLITAKIPFGASERMTKTFMNVDLSGISALFSEIDAIDHGKRANKNSKLVTDFGLVRSKNIFNQAHLRFKHALSSGVVTYEEKINLIVRLHEALDAAKPLANIGLSQGCAQTKDRGPAAITRAMLVCVAEAKLNENRAPNGAYIKFDENDPEHIKLVAPAAQMLRVGCMTPGGDVNGGSCGCSGSKAGTIAGKILNVSAGNAKANKVLKNISIKRDSHDFKAHKDASALNIQGGQVNPCPALALAVSAPHDRMGDPQPAPETVASRQVGAHLKAGGAHAA